LGKLLKTLCAVVAGNTRRTIEQQVTWQKDSGKKEIGNEIWHKTSSCAVSKLESGKQLIYFPDELMAEGASDIVTGNSQVKVSPKQQKQWQFRAQKIEHKDVRCMEITKSA
jgi:hypothetical protein